MLSRISNRCWNESKRLLLTTKSSVVSLKILSKYCRTSIRLYRRQPNQDPLFGIKATALSARRPLEEFLNKIQKYETALGPGRNRRALAGWTKGAQWVSLGDEAMKLQNHLNIHVGTVNMMLIRCGLAESVVQQDTLQEISRGVHAHVAQLTENNTLIGQLYSVVVNTIIPNLQNLVDIAERIARHNLDVYTLIFKMQSSVALCISPILWSQKPILFEDACQRRIEISSRFQYEEVLAIIKVRFSRGQCHQMILAGQLELHNISKNLQVCKENWFNFLPELMLR